MKVDFYNGTSGIGTVKKIYTQKDVDAFWEKLDRVHSVSYYEKYFAKAEKGISSPQKKLDLSPIEEELSSIIDFWERGESLTKTPLNETVAELAIAKNVISPLEILINKPVNDNLYEASSKLDDLTKILRFSSIFKRYQAETDVKLMLSIQKLLKKSEEKGKAGNLKIMQNLLTIYEKKNDIKSMFLLAQFIEMENNFGKRAKNPLLAVDTPEYIQAFQIQQNAINSQINPTIEQILGIENPTKKVENAINWLKKQNPAMPKFPPQISIIGKNLNLANIYISTILEMTKKMKGMIPQQVIKMSDFMKEMGVGREFALN